jgi:Ca-activated chloride channel family protein
MFNHFRCLIRAVFACCAVATFLGPSVARAETNVLFIFDASGSMKKPVGDTPRIDLARKSLIETVLAMPSNVRVGLMIYGARRAKDCTDIQLVSPVQANNRDQVVLSPPPLQAKGETPIADAIIKAAQTFSSLSGQDNSIVVLTDGIEECNGDPCAAAAAVSRMGINLKISIIGFTLGARERAAIECVVKQTGGRYYDAADARGLVNAMANVRQQVIAAPSQAPPPAPSPPQTAVAAPV